MYKILYIKKTTKMESKDYRILLNNEFHYKEMTSEDFDNTLMHFAKLYHEEQLNILGAGSCSLITELEKEGIANKEITQTNNSGLIDFVGFWESHIKDDEGRLSKKLHEFSEHEQAVLKRLLNVH